MFSQETDAAAPTGIRLAEWKILKGILYFFEFFLHYLFRKLIKSRQRLYNKLRNILEYIPKIQE